MMNVKISSLNFALKSTEKGLNQAGYFPGVSTLSGCCRILLGVVQVVGAVAFSIFKTVALLMKGASFKNTMRNVFSYPIMYGGHGLANIVRGSFEAVPFVNLLFIKYDKYFRICYPYEADV